MGFTESSSSRFISTISRFKLFKNPKIEGLIEKGREDPLTIELSITAVLASDATA